MKKKKIRVKYKNFIPIIIFIVIIILLIKSCNKEETKLEVPDFTNKDISYIKDFCNENNYEYKENYEYSFDYDENEIINYNVVDKTINVTISKGINYDSLIENNVNELGKVPIMMYHNIYKDKESIYGNGNVDKDGYNRTAEAFKNDLEYYYNKGYRFIRLIDYVNGIIDVPLGYSPIILTFDDGNSNNCLVEGIDSNGNLIIDTESAVGIMEEFKKKHPDSGITATFFVMDGLFEQPKYNEKILNYLVDNGYDIGNHTTNHSDFTTISTTKTVEVVGKMYQKLDNILGDKYVKIVALPYGSPYKSTHPNYSYIIKGNYNGYEYETKACLRVGWEPEVSPFNKSFDTTFLKRCRAFDETGNKSDDLYTIENTFNRLEKTRFISDGNKDVITIKKDDLDNVNTNLKVITY